MGDDKNYTNVILKEIRSQMSAVLEIVSNQPTREEFNNLREEFDSLKTDRRVTKLEESAS